MVERVDRRAADGGGCREGLRAAEVVMGFIAAGCVMARGDEIFGRKAEPGGGVHRVGRWKPDAAGARFAAGVGVTD